jgi:TRAP-type C4-dicarboxylate transport system substrate-binding protein
VSTARLSHASLVVALLMVGCAAGCAGTVGGDKAGGLPHGTGPLVLRLADTPYDVSDSPAVNYFVDRLEQLSRGTIRIAVTNQWGSYTSGSEARVIRAVASGRFDLGWVGSRVFDTVGDRSFDALSAPMLIDNYQLERAVVAGSIPSHMLSSLKRVGVAGLGLFAAALRYPIAVGRALLAPSDWRGIQFGTYRSDVQEEAIRALGAEPVEAFGTYRTIDVDSRRIQAFELDLPRYLRLGAVLLARHVTVNVPLWPEFDVLFANPARLESLTDRQRTWVAEAAAEATSRSVGLVPDSASEIEQACKERARFGYASTADLAGLRRAFAMVYRQLARDPETGTFLKQIERLKHETHPGPPAAVPPGCGGG